MDLHIVNKGCNKVSFIIVSFHFQYIFKRKKQRWKTFNIPHVNINFFANQYQEFTFLNSDFIFLKGKKKKRL